MKTFVLTDVIGNSHIVTENMVIITAVDKMLSGWGRATGKIAKRIVICEDWSQSRRIATNMRNQGFTYVSERSARIGLPYYTPSRYVVSVIHAKDCPAWNK